MHVVERRILRTNEVIKQSIAGVSADPKSGTVSTGEEHLVAYKQITERREVVLAEERITIS